MATALVLTGQPPVLEQRRDDFLPTLAHELRNLLGPVANALQLMQRSGGELQGPRAMMERQVRQMTRLVDDLLDTDRLGRQRLALQRSRVDLGLILAQSAEASRPAFEAARQTLTLLPTLEPVYLDADPDRLAQVFANLLGNAGKFTAAGGRIQVSLEQQGSDAVVRITDDGIGIPPSQLTRVFERFVQIGGSERAGSGLGIGLALAKQLVELHGGSITAQSEGVGLGSEFMVRLPILTERAVARPATAPEQPLGGQTPLRILLVDDNPDAVESLALLLARAGHETRTAPDGCAGLELAEAFRPEVILLDIGLPRMSGYDVCRAIRATSWGKDIVVIALTGWGHEDERLRTAEAGFSAHLVKPVDYAALTSLLDGAADSCCPLFV